MCQVSLRMTMTRMITTKIPMMVPMTPRSISTSLEYVVNSETDGGGHEYEDPLPQTDEEQD